MVPRVARIWLVEGMRNRIMPYLKIILTESERLQSQVSEIFNKMLHPEMKVVPVRVLKRERR
jgi:hypothetical protein